MLSSASGDDSSCSMLLPMATTRTGSGYTCSQTVTKMTF
jgi:hypothetical protein